MRSVAATALLLSLPACSLVTDADRDRLGPEIDLGGDCSAIESCDDGVPCTNDFCDADVGDCVHEPNDDDCGPGQTCSPTQGCIGGDSPCGGDGDCVDQTGCTVGHCDGDRCAWDPVDADQDGTARCSGDCDDTRGDVHPGAPESCGNGVDDDCNGATDLADAACDQPSCGTELVIRDHGDLEGDVHGRSALNSERCTRGEGPEAVVELTVSRQSDLVVSTEGSDVDTVLYVREGCDGAELGCSDNRSQARGWMDSRLFLEDVPPGTYTIVVDSADQGGGFRLRVDSDDARAPSCERPLDITGGGTVVGRTEGPDGDLGASCSEPTGPAAAFTFELGDGGQVTVATDDSEFDLIQDIQRSECGGDSAPGACLDQTGTGETFQGVLDSGRWVVVLDGYQGASGAYVLRFFP